MFYVDYERLPVDNVFFIRISVLLTTENGFAKFAEKFRPFLKNVVS